MRLHRKSLSPTNSIIIEGPKFIQVLCVFIQYAASYGEILCMSTKVSEKTNQLLHKQISG